MNIFKYLFWGGMLTGTLGQVIWSIIFWNSPLFILNDRLVTIGTVMVIFGFPYLYKLIKTNYKF